MINLLLIGSDSRIRSDILKYLSLYDDVVVSKALSQWKALDLMSQQRFDLAVIDESVGDQSGIELAGKLIKVDATMNLILVSSLSPGDFHEATEGLGVMAQLPKQPIADDIEQIVKTIRIILSQTSN